MEQCWLLVREISMLQLFFFFFFNKWTSHLLNLWLCTRWHSQSRGLMSTYILSWYNNLALNSPCKFPTIMLFPHHILGCVLAISYLLCTSCFLKSHLDVSQHISLIIYIPRSESYYALGLVWHFPKTFLSGKLAETLLMYEWCL